MIAQNYETAMYARDPVQHKHKLYNDIKNAKQNKKNKIKCLKWFFKNFLNVCTKI